MLLLETLSADNLKTSQGRRKKILGPKPEIFWVELMTKTSYYSLPETSHELISPSEQFT